MFIKEFTTDYYGRKRLIAKNDTHIIYKFFDWWQFTSIENYNAMVQDARKILKFDGFNSIDDCIEYANKYLS